MLLYMCSFLFHLNCCDCVLLWAVLYRMYEQFMWSCVVSPTFCSVFGLHHLLRDSLAANVSTLSTGCSLTVSVCCLLIFSFSHHFKSDSLLDQSSVQSRPVVVPVGSEPSTSLVSERQGNIRLLQICSWAHTEENIRDAGFHKLLHTDTHTHTQL